MLVIYIIICCRCRQSPRYEYCIRIVRFAIRIEPISPWNPRHPVAILQSYLLRISVWWDVLGFNYLLTKCLDVREKKHTLPTTKIAFGNRPGPIHFQTTDCQVGYFSASGISPRVHMLPVLLRCNFPIFFAVEKIRETMWNMKGKVYISHMRSPPEECNIYI